MIDTEKEIKLSLAPEKKKEYGAKEIKVLEGLEAVRKRPSMYIGSTDISGLHHLVYEVVDNSVDEALAGNCDQIKIILYKDGSCSVDDNGRGIPVDMHPTEKISAAEVVLTKLHAGGKFDKDAYKYSGGLHGVGVSVVNALSEEFEIQVKRNNKLYQQFYQYGKPLAPLKEIGTSTATGTFIKFKPDTKIFAITEFNFDTLSTRFRELSFLNKALTIDIEDERTDQKHSFFFKDGILSFIEHVNSKKIPLFKEIIEYHKEDDLYVIDFACQYNDGYSDQTFSFVNNIRTAEGGTHEAGFKGALTKSCNKYAQSFNLLKDGNFSSDDVREGLVAVLSIKIPEPQFEGQTKTKLGNAEIKGIVDSWLYAFFNTYFEENPTIAKKIIQKGIIAQQARNAAKKARDLTRRKTVLESSVLPGKLADCSDDNPSKTELYIVEGDSAGGCFSAETKVALVDGRNLSFLNIIKEYNEGKKLYCYTINENGNIDIALIKNPRRTKINANVIKVILDNGEEIICTPDHLFMLRDGSYKKAEMLSAQDSIMPLYRKQSEIKNRITIKDYEMHWQPNQNKWLFTHILADRFNLQNGIYKKENGSHKHHINFNKHDNSPANIERKKSKNPNLLKHETFYSKFFNGDTEKLKEAVTLYNHKIKEIIHLSEKMDVYDLEVENTHNFALASGIFVHNSAKQARDRFTQAILPLRGKIINVEKARLDKMLNNNEIKDLITAIGAGVGNEEFDFTKARYHKIIIMTDADVDGSHIRILLLTFFFRHMLPLINQGYLYIAQPPLYKVKVGKRSKYLKDDSELLDFLFGWAAESTELQLENQTLSGEAWEKQLKAILNYQRELIKLSQMIEVTTRFGHELALFLRQSKWEKNKFSTTDIISKLKAHFTNYEVSSLLEENLNADINLEGDVKPINYITFKYLKRSWELPLRFFEMEETSKILTSLNAINLNETSSWSFGLQTKETRDTGTGILNLCDIIIKAGKTLMTIQRYKGLGEMNPEQLWETTMDPEVRTILKVNIQDAIEADQWFTSLMGDAVEERRSYIEKHAHFVRNLDV